MNKLALLALVIAACSSSGSDDLADLRRLQPSIDRAQFDTSTSIAANPAPAVTASVTFDAARNVYADMLGLLELHQSAPTSCPASFGVTYQVVFYAADAELVTATLNPAGCEFVTLTSKTGSAVFGATLEFWSQLSADLGITEAQIYPYQPPGR